MASKIILRTSKMTEEDDIFGDICIDDIKFEKHRYNKDWIDFNMSLYNKRIFFHRLKIEVDLIYKELMDAISRNDSFEYINYLNDTYVKRAMEYANLCSAPTNENIVRDCCGLYFVCGETCLICGKYFVYRN